MNSSVRTQLCWSNLKCKLVLHTSYNAIKSLLQPDFWMRVFILRKLQRMPREKIVSEGTRLVMSKGATFTLRYVPKPTDVMGWYKSWFNHRAPGWKAEGVKMVIILSGERGQKTGWVCGCVCVCEETPETFTAFMCKKDRENFHRQIDVYSSIQFSACCL